MQCWLKLRGSAWVLFPSSPCGCHLLALYPGGDVRFDLHYSPWSRPGAIEFLVYSPWKGLSPLSDHPLGTALLFPCSVRLDIFLVTKVAWQIFPYSSIHSLKNFLLSLDERWVIRWLFWRRPLLHCVNRLSLFPAEHEHTCDRWMHTKPGGP